jgi:hypothetical protein
MKKKKTTKAGANADFEAAFAGLKQIFQRHRDKLTVLADKSGNYTLLVKSVQYRGKPLWFGAVCIMKSYVSFHLLPLYMNPALRKQVSPELKKRMQGKACFNFTAPDKKLFRELAKLTDAGLKHFRALKPS